MGLSMVHLRLHCWSADTSSRKPLLMKITVSWAFSRFILLDSPVVLKCRGKSGTMFTVTFLLDCWLKHAYVVQLELSVLNVLFAIALKRQKAFFVNQMGFWDDFYKGCHFIVKWIANHYPRNWWHCCFFSPQDKISTFFGGFDVFLKTIL